MMRELERRFPPEFRNRIDDVVVFAPLTRDEVRQIARDLARRGRRRRCAARQVAEIDDDALDADRRARLQPRLRRAVPEARHRRARQAADQRTLDRRQQFRVRVEGDGVVVDQSGPRLVSSSAEPPRAGVSDVRYFTLLHTPSTSLTQAATRSAGPVPALSCAPRHAPLEGRPAAAAAPAQSA